MNIVPFTPMKPGEKIPHCEVCNRPVDSISWERYFDAVALNGYVEHIPNGCGHIEVRCHGETWRVQFYPWGFGEPTMR